MRRQLKREEQVEKSIVEDKGGKDFLRLGSSTTRNYLESALWLQSVNQIRVIKNITE